MKQETLKKAIELNKELESISRITEILYDALSPVSIQFWNEDHYSLIPLTNRTCLKIKEAFKELHAEIEKELEAL